MDSGDLHYCEAFPIDANDSSLINNASPSSKCGRFFNINVKVTETKLVFNPKNDDFDCLNDKTTEYRFANMSVAKMEKESTVARMLSEIGVPDDVQYFMTFKIMACARNMAQCTHKTRKVLPMQVLIYITTSVEEDSNLDEEEEQEQEQEGFADELKKDQSDNSLIPQKMLDEELQRAKV